ncbi:MAG: ABC transporter ATP-binding protein [Proteobacteria bacterium]|nr:ABC transporter ATP-binding protein [Pseudomonadota bacterium]NCA28746.1 ABC transporter ATP-binding protein [Pseudomonadota bacterium]
METNYNSTPYLIKRISIETIKPHWKMLIVSIILMIVIAGTTSFHAWLIKPALDSVFVEKDYHALIYIPIVVLIVTAVKGFATYFQLLSMNYINLRITSDLRIKLYRHFITSDISKLHSKSSGDMVASIINEIGAVVNLISISLNGFVKQFFTLFALIIVMFNQSLELSLVAFIGFPLAVYPIYKLGKKLRNLSFKNQEMASKFNSQMTDTLQYSKLVKAYHCEEFEISRMTQIIESIFKVGKKISRISLVSSPFMESLAGFGVAAVIWYGGHQVISGKTTPGAFFSFFTAMMMAYRPLKSLSGMNSSVQMGLASATRLFILFDEKPKIINKPNAIDLKNIRGDIEFSNVKFSYSDNKVALDNISFRVEAGQSVALVGHSGGGKSTIMSMILRFYDPTQGQVKLDGNNIADITLKSLRNSMSVVNQEVMLFDDTILENIRYGKVDATEEQILRASKMAEADEFIQELPEKYNSRVGQNGIRLSGGQRQRIAIARAILYDAPILLLDEATSSLDPISEKLIKDALNSLMKNRTSIIIAHRLSTIIHCDKIIVIANGRVVEEGSHKELLEKNGAYANLYLKQFEINQDV